MGEMMRMAAKPQIIPLSDEQDQAIRRSTRIAVETGRLELPKMERFRYSTVEDVVSNLRRFSWQLEVFGTRNAPYPGIHLGNNRIVPFDALGSFSTRFRKDFTRPDEVPWDDVLNYVTLSSLIVERMGLIYEPLTLTDARQSYQIGLYNFLKSRVQGVMGGAPGIAALDEEVTLITVNTRNPGLQVLFHEEFHPGRTRVFGNSLSTPVKGIIPGGWYLFGGRGPTVPEAFDPHPFDIPTITIVNTISV